MEDNLLKLKREESLKNIQEAFLLAKGDSSNELNLSDIVDNIQNDAFEKETVFGFNVRLKRDDVIIPLLGGRIWKARNFDFDAFSDSTDPELTIPEIFKELKERTIEFTLNDDNTIEDFCADNEFKNREDKCFNNVINCIENEKSFAIAQKKFLFPKEKRVHFWISRECDDLTSGETTYYLSNILIITTQKDHIEFVKKNRLDFLRFLFKMEIAYAAILEKSRKKEAIKSAKAAIMSRNMSHNLGSHFISNTKNFFTALIDVDNKNGAVYRGVKYALQYIQERMDFIATVTSDDIYPFGAVNVKAQIFDELTPDNLGKRHDKKSLNFLMDYLVLSEKISKRSYLNCENKAPLLSEGQYELKLLLGFEDQSGNVFFWNSEKTTLEDNKIRDFLVNINVAIPGGILGKHALFSIIENIIRNAAKHGQNKIRDKFIIKMLCTNDGHFIIYDNKLDSDIKNTVKNLNNRLSELKMYNYDNSLNQDNKGLKEILICSIWLQNEDFFQALQSRNFEKYVQILAMDKEKDGKEIGNDTEEGYLGYKIRLDRYKKVIHLNDEFEIPEDAEEISNEFLKTIKSDILCASKDYKVGDMFLSQIFPRFVIVSLDKFQKMIIEKGENIVSIDLLRSIVEKNCHIKTDSLQMVVSSDKRNDFTDSEPYPIAFCDIYKEKSKDDFLYKVHAGKSKWSKFETLYFSKGFENKYIDSISGGDFTHTIVQPSFVKDGYNLLKIYESVKTRFVVIDERLFEQHRSSITRDQREEMISMVKDIQGKIARGKKTIDNLMNYVFVREYKVLGTCEINEENKAQIQEFIKDNSNFLLFLEKDIEHHYLERRDIHILNFDNNHGHYELNDLSFNEFGHFESKGSGIEFQPQNGQQHYFESCGDSPITFLSIHLGLIDKIADSLGLAHMNDFDESQIVEALKDYFRASFVSIHSGRGGIDVRNSLKKYVFQSYSAVENPLHNSKYLLAQQFYNLNYYGDIKKSTDNN